MNEDDAERLLRRVREQLRASETLDPVARARLSAVRARALDASGSRRWAWAGAGAALAAALLAALLVLPPTSPPSAQADVVQAEAFELLFEEDATADPEFYEDLELLHWLAQGEQRA